MGTETQEQPNGQGGTGGAGGPNTGAAQAIGTGTRAPIFQQQETQEQGAAGQQGGETAASARPGRGPVTTATIPPDALKQRLDRAKAQGAEPYLKELGVKTEAEAREKLAKLKASEQEGEKRRLAEMSEIDRLKAENEQLRAQLEAAKQQITTHAQERGHEQYEQVVTRVAGELIDTEALPLFRLHLAQHVKKLALTNPELAEKFSERGVKRFAEKWSKDHPKFAKAPATTETTTDSSAAPARGAAPAAAAKGGQPAPVRRPVTTGMPQRKNGAPPIATTAPQTGMAGGKTVRPGHANSMSAREVKDHFAKQGIHYSPLG